MIDWQSFFASFNGWDGLGLVGVVILNYTYARLQHRREYAKEIEYSILNCVASLCLVLSLSNKFNFASFLGNSIWLVMSGFGVYRCWQYKKRGNAPHGTCAAPITEG